MGVESVSPDVSASTNSAATVSQTVDSPTPPDGSAGESFNSVYEGTGNNGSGSGGISQSAADLGGPIELNLPQPNTSPATLPTLPDIPSVDTAQPEPVSDTLRGIVDLANQGQQGQAAQQLLAAPISQIATSDVVNGIADQFGLTPEQAGNLNLKDVGDRLGQEALNWTLDNVPKEALIAAGAAITVVDGSDLLHKTGVLPAELTLGDGDNQLKLTGDATFGPFFQDFQASVTADGQAKVGPVSFELDALYNTNGTWKADLSATAQGPLNSNLNVNAQFDQTPGTANDPAFDGIDGNFSVGSLADNDFQLSGNGQFDNATGAWNANGRLQAQGPLNSNLDFNTQFGQTPGTANDPVFDGVNGSLSVGSLANNNFQASGNGQFDNATGAWNANGRLQAQGPLNSNLDANVSFGQDGAGSSDPVFNGANGSLSVGTVADNGFQVQTSGQFDNATGAWNTQIDAQVADPGQYQVGVSALLGQNPQQSTPDPVLDNLDLSFSLGDNVSGGLDLGPAGSFQSANVQVTDGPFTGKTTILPHGPNFGVTYNTPGLNASLDAGAQTNGSFGANASIEGNIDDNITGSLSLGGDTAGNFRSNGQLNIDLDGDKGDNSLSFGGGVVNRPGSAPDWQVQGQVQFRF